MATAGFTLTKDKWTDLGETPCMIESLSTYLTRFVVSAVEPPALDVPAHTLGSVAGYTRTIALAGLRVFARADDHPAAVIISSASVGVEAVASNLDLSRGITPETSLIF